MKKLLKNISHKTIFWFYSITSLYSIFWSYLFRPTDVSSDSFFNHLLNAFNIFDLNLYTAVYFLREIRIIRFDLYANAFYKIEIIFPLLILTAALIFRFSKFKDSRLLRYLLSISIVLMVLGFFSGLAYRLFLLDKFPLSSWLIFLAYKVIAVVVIIFHYATITKLNTEDELSYTLNSKEETTFVLASRGQRFMNYLIDCFPRIIVMLLISSILMSLARVGVFNGNLDGPVDEYLFRYALVVIGIVLVYFITERLFLRSPSKFLTNTQVIVKGDNHKSYTILKRTLTRAIPVIDLLSYVFSEKGDGFHDEWSETMVVKNKPKGMAYGWYFLIFPIVMFLPFTPSIIKNEIDKMKYREVSSIYEDNKKNKSLENTDLNFIDKGELFEIDDNTYSSQKYIYIVDSIKADNIYASRLIQKHEQREFNDTYTLMDYKRDYDEELLKVVFDKTNLKDPLKLVNPKHTYVIDVRLRKNSWSYNTTGEKVNSYSLEIETNTHSSAIIAFRNIEGELALTKGSSSVSGVNLKINTEKNALENKDYIVEVKLQNQTSLKTATYQIKFTKYGVLDFYKVN